MKKFIGLNVEKTLYDWLKSQAEKNQRSLSGQIVYLLSQIKEKK